MDELKHNILIQINNKPVKNKLLAKRLGFKNDRLVRKVVHNLIIDGYPIIFTKDGLKLAQDVDEIDSNLASLKSYLKNIGNRYKYLKLARTKFTGQMKMRLNK